MCLADYRIGARMHPVKSRVTLDASQLGRLKADSNRLAVFLSVPSDDVAAFVGTSTLRGYLAMAFTSAALPAVIFLSLKTHGAVVFEEIFVTSTVGTAVEVVEMIGEPGLVEDIMKGEW